MVALLRRIRCGGLPAPVWTPLYCDSAPSTRRARADGEGSRACQFRRCAHRFRDARLLLHGDRKPAGTVAPAHAERLDQPRLWTPGPRAHLADLDRELARAAA